MNKQGLYSEKWTILSFCCENEAATGDFYPKDTQSFQNLRQNELILIVIQATDSCVDQILHSSHSFYACSSQHHLKVTKPSLQDSK